MNKSDLINMILRDEHLCGFRYIESHVLYQPNIIEVIVLASVKIDAYYMQFVYIRKTNKLEFRWRRKLTYL